MILVIASVLTSLVALKLSYSTYKEFGTTFYRYLTIVFLCFTFMSLGYFFQIFIINPAEHLLVMIGTLSFSAGGFAGLACVVGAAANER